jgi:hypothetical protein
MITQPVVHLFSFRRAEKDKPLKAVPKRLGSATAKRAGVTSAFSGSSPGEYVDPYLLLLLADQELVEGRTDQARYLVETAYDFFDRKAAATAPKLHVAG